MASLAPLYPDYLNCSSEEMSTVAQNLDVKMWKNLPENLMDMLVMRIPFCDRIILRRVCKSWNENILRCCHSIDDVQSLPIMVTGFSLTIYNVRRNAWREKSLREVYLKDVVKALETDGGLICVLTKHSESLLIVHNPLSNKTRYLAAPANFRLPLEKPNHPFGMDTVRARYLSEETLHWDGLTGLYKGMIGFISNKQRESYGILMASTVEGSTRTTFVYDSETRSWSEGGKVPAGVVFWYGGDSRIVCRGSLYCLAQGQFVQQEYLSCMLVKYDMSFQMWTVFRVPHPGIWPNNGYPSRPHPFLVEHRKEVLYIVPDRDRRLLFFRLNESDSSQPCSWECIYNMPTSLWAEYIGKADEVLSRCVGKGNLVYITGRKRKGAGVIALVFDPARCVYKWLPELKDDHLISQLRCYEPSVQPV